MAKQNKLLVATHNKAKLEEMSLGIKEYAPDLEIVSLKDLDITEEPEETGRTFEENARLKAHFYADLAKLPVIADDGGILIDYLHGEPGIKSRRWLGYEMTDEELIEHTLKVLKGVPMEKRTASFKTVICFYDPETKTEIVDYADIKGHISEKRINMETYGYPFRLIFIVDELNKYYSEITPEEHLKISHRLKALKRLMKKVQAHLLQ